MTAVSQQLQTRFLDSLAGVRNGSLLVNTPDGATHRFGDGGPEAELHIRDWRMLSRLARRGNVGLGEGWIAGDWHSDTLENLLVVALDNLDRLGSWATPGPLATLRMRLHDGLSLRRNHRAGASRNIKAHYDVGNEFFQQWLDPGMTYSSALFDEGVTDLGAAQARKNRRILSRLGEGGDILEIGCGWGGFAEQAAETGRDVTAITISPSQKGYADARLDGRADVRLQDYRDVQGKYSNIVSIEMMEAVGERYWPDYFEAIKARLADGGRAVLQVITVPDAEFSVYRQQTDFIRRHVFPGGMLPCMAGIGLEASRAGLTVRATHAFGQHYARTCRMWSDRMSAAESRIRRLGYDEAFLRGWKFYLDGCAATFATKRCDVLQIELEHTAGT
ncbi:class I SAM-dependent methyltransferase [Amaricoccus tamworthensis]|uniref:class I SAM-dependent methyltransferase n=1 Tax=Amaricoccus tamworthensis TaxID=57002 RepID=UPI003C7A1473